MPEEVGTDYCVVDVSDPEEPLKTPAQTEVDGHRVLTICGDDRRIYSLQWQCLVGGRMVLPG